MTAQVESVVSADELASRAAVTDLIYTYCHGLDRRDLERFLGVWDDGAVWDFNHPQIPVAKGRETIAGMVQMFWGAFIRMHHLSSNILVTTTGDSASAVWDAAAVFEDQTGKTSNLVASYTDEFRRLDGRWVTTSRSITLDPQIELGA